ncbi:Autophagy-related protein 101 [Balamuthia mandrillaris]
MNIQQFALKELEVEPGELKEVLRCLLHTVMFHRAFGLVHPREELIEPLDFAYVRCDDIAIHKHLEEQVEQFEKIIQQRENKKAQVVMSFFEKRYKKIWFRKYEEKVCFEQWIFTFQLTNEPETGDPQERRDRLSSRLRKRVMTIIQIVNEKKNHIPPLKTNDLTPFPYQVSFPSASESWGVDMVWNMLKTPQPLLN